MDFLVTKLNSTFLQITSEQPHIIEEISQYFTITIPDSQYMRKGHYRYWDGKLRLFNKRKGTLYVGLLKDLLEFAQNSRYKVDVDDTLLPPDKDLDLVSFVRSLRLKHKPRDYQLEAFDIANQRERAVILSSTGSGKSLIIYMIIRQFEHEPILLIVPTIGLTTQMYNDFRDYAENDDSWNVNEQVHVITGGVPKDSEQSTYISTWQSLYNLPKEYFHKFRTVIVDETHLASADSIKRILENSINADRRIGLTGTLQDTKTHLLTIQGLLGPIRRVTNTSELQKRDILANIEIDMILLQYSEEQARVVSKMNYGDEIDFLVQHPERNSFLINLVKKQTQNTLLLTSLVEKHGQVVHDKLKDYLPNRNVFFVYGDMPKDERERIRQFAEENDNVVIVATYQVFSTGVNIKNLHTIVFALAGKSKIRNLQSIGRGLRTHENKKSLRLIDIGDDLRNGGTQNYSFKHFEERYRLYLSEQFNAKIHQVLLSTTSTS